MKDIIAHDVGHGLYERGGIGVVPYHGSLHEVWCVAWLVEGLMECILHLVASKLTKESFQDSGVHLLSKKGVLVDNLSQNYWKMHFQALVLTFEAQDLPNINLKYMFNFKIIKPSNLFNNHHLKPVSWAYVCVVTWKCRNEMIKTKWTWKTYYLRLK